MESGLTPRLGFPASQGYIHVTGNPTMLQLRFHHLVAGSIVGLFMSLSAAHAAGTIELPRTGQTTCYDPVNSWEIPCPGSGQDGDSQSGVAWPSPRFVDNGDGTVTDNLTGLMWFKDAGCMGQTTWQAAMDRIADLNATPGSYSCDGFHTASYTDWVLPNINELKSLAYHRPGGRAWLQGQGFRNVANNAWYWSSTTQASNTSYEWSLHPEESKVEPQYFGYNRWAWPVRAGQ